MYLEFFFKWLINTVISHASELLSEDPHFAQNEMSNENQFTLVESKNGVAFIFRNFALES